MLAGPGTGKTTTLVEAIVDRIEQRGADPDAVLALTFSRKAAEQLRDRVTARLGRTMSPTLSSTFHSFAYGLIRALRARRALRRARCGCCPRPSRTWCCASCSRDHPESVALAGVAGRALGTRGFAREVQAVLARAREKGLDGAGSSRSGAATALPEFVAAGLFLEQYLDNPRRPGRHRLRRPDPARDDRGRASTATSCAPASRHVFVDEYQDTDPGQVALLRALAGDGRDLTVVGDPHQSIYGFRGAEVRGILEFPTDVPARPTARRPTWWRCARPAGSGRGCCSPPSGSPAASRCPAPSPRRPAQAFLAPVAVAGAHGDGRVEVLTFDTERAEAEHLADLLRRAHLEDGIAWDDMAVLVRSGPHLDPGAAPLARRGRRAGRGRRRRGAAGARPGRAAAARRAAGRRSTSTTTTPTTSTSSTPRRAEALLLGPLGGLDAGDVRRLGAAAAHAREGRGHGRRAAARAARASWSAGCVVDPDFLDGLDGPRGRPGPRPRDPAAGAPRRAALDGGHRRGGAVAAVVRHRLARAAAARGRARRRRRPPRAPRPRRVVRPLRGRRAGRGAQRDHLGVANFLATLVAQQIPADTLAERGVRGASVRLLTAHRAKGLEWRLVVVAHVQQDGWPDLRRRSHPAPGRPDRRRRPGAAGHARASCSSRSAGCSTSPAPAPASGWSSPRSRRPTTTASSRPGSSPSCGSPAEHHSGRPRRPLSLAGLVGELRRTSPTPTTPPALREAAARRLARAGRRVASAAGRWCPQADPADLVGHPRRQPAPPQPVRDPDQPVPLSASMLDGADDLPDPVVPRPARPAGSPRSHQSANLGQIVHALAERVGHRRAGRRPRRRRPADGARRRGLGPAGVPHAVVRGPRARPGPRPALARFLAWHHANPRTPGRHRGAASPRSSSSPTASRCGSAATPTASSSTPTAGSSSSTSRPAAPSRPTRPVADATSSSASTSSPSTTAPSTRSCPARPARGGAELVQLGAARRAARGGRAAPGRRRPTTRPSATRCAAALAVAAGYLRARGVPGHRPAATAATAPSSRICPAKGAGSVVTQ